MLVAIIYDGIVTINEYPMLKNIEDIRNDFLPETIFIELSEKPEIKDGYVLKYNGEKIYYEEILSVKTEPNQSTNTEVMQAISDLQADLIIAGVL